MNSNDQKILDEIEQAAKKFSNYLVNHLNRTDPNNHSNIKKYQEDIYAELKETVRDYLWKMEEKATPLAQDSIDIYGKTDDNKNKQVVIEIDASRHDQIATKFISRLSLVGLNEPLLYVALLYPDTQNNINTCRKYIRYANNIAKQINRKSSVIGVFVYVNKGMGSLQTKGYIEEWDYGKKYNFYIGSASNNILKGMTECTAEVIKEYIKLKQKQLNKKNKTFYYEDLVANFNSHLSIISNSKGKSRYHNTGVQLPTKTGSITTVFTYTQWRQTNMSWNRFLTLCEKKGIKINQVWKRI
jgi:hypothetical protein